MPETRQSRLAPREDEDHANAPTESSPLLANRRGSGGSSSPRTAKRRWPWPSLIAIASLGALVVAIIVVGFMVPPAVQQYAESAVVLEPTSLSLESLTADGIRVRVRANLRLDGSRVADDGARRIGRLATSIVRQLATDETRVSVRLPRYGNALVGAAVVPPLVVDLVDGHNNQLDFAADVAPGDAETLRRIVNDWLDGKLDQLTVTGAAALQLKAGFLPLGTHDVVESIVFEAHDMPSIPEYKVQSLVFHDVPIGHGGQMGVGANVSVTLHNDHPIGLDVPSLRLQVLVPNCDPSEPNIKVASAVTSVVHLRPEADVTAEAMGVIREIPESLTRPCPGTDLSPLDKLVEHYLHGGTNVLVRMGPSGASDVPGWVGSVLDGVTVPVALPGGSFDSVLRNFSLTDVDFRLPGPLADPDAADGKPRVSGTVRVLAALPAELKMDLGVDGLRARGDLVYRGRKFGELNLRRWQKANSTIASGSADGDEVIAITSRVVDAPIDITDSDTFSDLVQRLFFGGGDIVLDVGASVDLKVVTVLGKLVLKGVPAQGKIPVKHVSGDALAALNPRVGDLLVVDTSDSGIHMQATINLTNATPYTATVPFVSVHVMKQGCVLGEATARHVRVRTGSNSGIAVSATWDPLAFAGKRGQRVGRRLLSDYLSGKRAAVELRAHRGSVPAIPAVGEALSRLNVTLDIPRLQLPGGGDGGGGDDGGGGGFVRDATFHILTSTATFTLASPLRRDTVRIERINATAFYNHTEPIGHIVYDEPFDAPPGLTPTPRLPVQWSPSHVGRDKLRDALGGSLKLDARAGVTIRLGRWVDDVEYEGRGIGAKVGLLG